MTVDMQQLSRRERQIMSVIYRRERATVAEVLQEMPDPPSYSTVRALLVILEKKGAVRHILEGQRYIYLPTAPSRQTAQSALQQVVQTFFAGSVESTVLALLDSADIDLSAEKLSQLEKLISEAKLEGR